MAATKSLGLAKIRALNLRYFNGFAGLYTPLKALLDKIRSAGKDAVSAYSAAQSGKLDYGKDEKGKVKIGANGQPSEVKVLEPGAKTVIEDYVKTLTATEIGYLSGLGFTAPNDDKKKRTDVVNSVLSSWDKSASKYMKQELAAGDAAASTLKSRLDEYDTAIRTQGKTPVKPDT